MLKIFTIIIALLAVLMLFSACEASVVVSDGVYRVEMAEFDENGYKDFVEFTVKSGKVTSITADGYSEENGSLKTDSADIRREMETINGTYPEKFYRDLVNEYIGSGGTQTDVIAGATLSSENFFRLMEVAKNAANTGDISIRIVEKN